MADAQFSEWLKVFKQLHERWKLGQLNAQEKQEYLGGRQELARVMLRSQKIVPQPGQVPADALRIARALQCEVKIGGAWVKGLTSDVGLDGFSVQQPARVRAGDPMDYQIWLPGALLAMTGHGKVVDVRRVKADMMRISVNYAVVKEDERKRLETMVFDAVITQMRLPQPSGKPPL